MPGGASQALLGSCFWLSGFSALLYQTAWLRSFSLVFGTSEFAVAAVLAAYMAGLAVGASFGARLAARVERPVFTYGVLEGGIALSALLVPMLIGGAGVLYALAVGGQDTPPPAQSTGQLVFYLAAGFVVLVVPTALMGATFPVLIGSVVGLDREIGRRTARLYGLNTFGAVIGTLLTGFVLLPRFGLITTIWVEVVSL